MDVFTAQQLLEEINKVGNTISKKTTAYLIGGCSMSLRGLKSSTKDVDLVFTDINQLNAFAEALEKLGYVKILETTDEYKGLAAEVIYRKQNAAGFDLFLNRVCRGLILSKEMKLRGTKLNEFGLLTVFLCSEEDVFLFKSITERPRDVDDMASLLQAKLDKFDWKCLKTEIENQTPAYFNLPTLTYNKICELEEKYEIRTLIKPWLLKKSNTAILNQAVQNRIEKGMSREQALNDLKKMGFTKKELESLECG